MISIILEKFSSEIKESELNTNKFNVLKLVDTYSMHTIDDLELICHGDTIQLSESHHISKDKLEVSDKKQREQSEMALTNVDTQDDEDQGDYAMDGI